VNLVALVWQQGTEGGQVPVVLALLGAAALLLLGIILWRRYQSRRALVRRVEELTALSRASSKIVEAQLDVDALCALIYEQAGAVVYAPTYQIGLYDGDAYDIRLWVVRGERRAPARFPLAPDESEGLINWLRRARRPLIVSDFALEAASLPARPRYMSDEPPRSALFVPLLAGPDIVGAISVQSDQPGAFTPDHQRLLSIIANQAAAAIQNARLLEQARARAGQLELIGQVGRQVAAILDLDDLLVRVVGLVQETFGYYCINLLTVNPRTAGPDGAPAGALILEATTSEIIRRNGLPVAVGEGIIGTAAGSGQTVLVNDVSADPRYVYVQALPDTRAELAVPLKIEDRVLGVLDVQSTAAGAFGPDDCFVVETLADQIAVAIHEARLYQAARRRAQQLDAIAQVSRAVVSLLDLDELLVQVADLIAGRFRFPQVGIFLIDSPSRDLVFRAGHGPLAALWKELGLRYRADGEGLIPWVARYGDALLVRDVSAEPRYHVGPGEQGHGTEMTVPLRMAGHVLGVLDVSSPEVDAFGDDDLFVVQTLADAVAIAVRNATLYASERRRRLTAEALRQVAATLTSTLELQAVLDRILEGLARVVHFDAAAILLLGEDEQVTVAAAHGLGAVVAAVGSRLQLGDTARLRELSQSHRPTVFGEYDGSGAYHGLLGLPEDHACLGAPLLARDELIGFLAVDALEPGRYDGEDAAVVMTFAHQAAIALDNARLFTTQREEAWMSTALLQVADATGQSTELEDVLATVTRITPLLVGVDRCALLLWEEERWRGTHAYQTEGGWIELFGQVQLRPGEWPALDGLRVRGEPVAIDQPAGELAYSGSGDGRSGDGRSGDGRSGSPAGADPQAVALPEPIALVFGQLSLLLLPLLAKGHVMGAMIVGHSDPAFNRRRIDLISGIANQTALAIEGAQLYTAQQEEVWVSTALLQVAEAVGTLTDLDQVLATIVRLAPLLIGVERCAVLLWDELPGQFTPGASFGLEPEDKVRFDALRLRPGDAPALATARLATGPVAIGAGQPVALSEPLGALLGREGALVLPLVSKGNFLGVLLVDWPAAVERAGRRRLNILTGMAHQAALAIESARLYADLAAQQRLERELEVAREIQMSFLPERAPVEPGWQVAAFYRAARSVGGDFYDFIRLPDARWGLIIADVSDKGIGAALFMALSRTLLRAVAISGRSPGASLVRVNELLLADARTDLFVTGFYAAWSPATARLVYASAGHNPPLLIHHRAGPDRPEVERLTGKGIALGVIPNIELEEQSVRLLKGDVLVLYTDGVTEALSADYEEFGLERLATTILAHREHSADDIVAAVRAAVEEFTVGVPQFDDFTMVVLKRTQPDQ
jgi:GAF domain-containing protein